MYCEPSCDNDDFLQAGLVLTWWRVRALLVCICVEVTSMSMIWFLTPLHVFSLCLSLLFLSQSPITPVSAPRLPHAISPITSTASSASRPAGISILHISLLSLIVLFKSFCANSDLGIM